MRYSEEQYREAARSVWLDVLDHEHAVTVSEIEARASDRVWKPQIWPTVINPHHLGNAQRELLREGVIEPASGPTVSHPEPIVTWSRVPTYGIGTKIKKAAARKRLLTARHAGWSQRGGGSGLIGGAGERALDVALRGTDSKLTQPTGSTLSVLDVNLRPWGEVDNSAYFVDVSDPAGPTAITVMFEVKNKRAWYYANDAEVLAFLAKAAVVQAERPAALILPVFIARKVQWTLWEQGEEDGFLPLWVDHQLVASDYELTQENFDEVYWELGFHDMTLVHDKTTTTNYHTGIARSGVPKRARTYAERWQTSHRRYLPDSYVAIDAPF